MVGEVVYLTILSWIILDNFPLEVITYNFNGAGSHYTL
jgi:hypothetical protein